MIYINNQQVEEVILGQAGGTVNLDDYYKKTETYSKQQIDDKNFLTEHQPIDHLASKTDLENYQTKGDYVTNSELSQKGFIVEIPSEYVTDSELTQKGFLTEHQKLKTINDQSIIGEGNIVIEGTGGDVSGKLDKTVYEEDKKTFALKSEIPTEYLKDVINKDNVISFSDNSVKAQTRMPTVALGEKDAEFIKINDKPIFYFGSQHNVGEIGNIDIYTKQQIDNKNFLTTIPANYVTTEKLADYALKSWVTSEIDSKVTGSTVNLDDYYKKSETYSQQEIDSKGYLTSHQSLEHLATKEELGGYVTNDTLNSKGYLTEHQDISTKLDKTVYDEDKKSYATKSEIPSVAGLATKEEVGLKADKTYVDGLIGDVNIKINEIKNMI